MNFDQWVLVLLIVMTVFNLTTTVAHLAKGGNKNKNFMPTVFVLASLGYIAFYIHLAWELRK